MARAGLRKDTPAEKALSPLARKRAEARCRYYVRDESTRLGWKVDHPNSGGSFLEEQELVDYFPPLRGSLGDNRPDFGILLGDKELRAVIECKNDFHDLDKAVVEACEYADTINTTRGFDVRVAIGVAGCPDQMVLTRAKFLVGKKWKDLTSHDYSLTQLPTLRELEIAIENGDGTTDVQLPSEKEFYDAAIRISRILRLSKIKEADRPKVLGAIILALYHGDFSFKPDVVIEQINVNVHAAIDAFEDVPAVRRNFLAKTLELGTESDRLREDMPSIVHQLERLNVRSIVRSGVDFLGKFYDAFLRYGSDSKKMGIVFTPRHITPFCAELIDLRLGMTVYDPAAGTGGFLVAAFDRMMKDATTEKARKVAKESLYGSDTDATVWALAVLNMFFRGDGKSHIEKGSCFNNEEAYRGKFDRVLMNPPFSQEGEPEIKFINHALSCTKPGGELAVVVKTGVMVDPNLAGWRKALVAEHHVLSVISLPVDLFYPTGSATVILHIRAHSPDRKKGTFLAQVHNDGYEISKNRRVECPGSQLPEVMSLHHEFLKRNAIRTVPGLACVVDRDMIVNGDEICAEHWLPSASFALDSFERWRQEAFRQMSLALSNYPDAIDELISDYEEQLAIGEVVGRPQQRTSLDEWFDVSGGASAGCKNYEAGSVPYVSSGDTYNSIVGLVAPPEDEVYDSPHVSVTGFGQASVQPWRFCARGNGGSAVRILRPRFAMTLAELFWFVGQINAQRWRFHFGRMAIGARLKRLEVDPPPDDLPVVSNLDRRLKRFREELDRLWTEQSRDDDLEIQFQSLVREWKAGRGPRSSIARMAMHPAYQRIIAMGEPAVPLILSELQREPDHWFAALNRITGENPIQQSQAGKLPEMSKAWLRWGRGRGYVK